MYDLLEQFEESGNEQAAAILRWAIFELERKYDIKIGDLDEQWITQSQKKNLSVARISRSERFFCIVAEISGSLTFASHDPGSAAPAAVLQAVALQPELFSFFLLDMHSASSRAISDIAVVRDPALPAGFTCPEVDPVHNRPVCHAVCVITWFSIEAIDSLVCTFALCNSKVAEKTSELLLEAILLLGIIRCFFFYQHFLSD